MGNKVTIKTKTEQTTGRETAATEALARHSHGGSNHMNKKINRV